MWKKLKGLVFLLVVLIIASAYHDRIEVFLRRVTIQYRQAPCISYTPLNITISAPYHSPSSTNSSASPTSTTAKIAKSQRSTNELLTENVINLPQKNITTIYMITPTYKRLTQKSDLTSLCLTVMHVPNLVWIVVEDSAEKTQLVTNLLSRCKVFSMHLHVQTPEIYKSNEATGAAQRNAGLAWIRKCHTIDNCSGIVYFGDDDNKYDLRLFDKMRETKKVSVWPVAFCGGVKVEGPICKDGKIEKWHNGWGAYRPFPIDMAGFAINISLMMKNPKVQFGRDSKGKLTKPGYLETDLLEQLIDKKELECRGLHNETIVWHVRTSKPNTSNERKTPSDTAIEI